jgi:hypothetical protein
MTQAARASRQPASFLAQFATSSPLLMSGCTRPSIMKVRSAGRTSRAT